MTNKLKWNKYAWMYMLLKSARVMVFGWSNVTYVLFLLDKGIELPLVNVINICFMTTILLFDPFTGKMADKIGQKLIFWLGLLVSSIGVLIYGFGLSFEHFVLAEVTVGIGYSLMSEAPESWLRNKLGATLTHDIQSLAGSYTRIISMIPIFLGGIIGTRYGLQLPWLISGISGLLVVIAFSLFLFKEEDVKGDTSDAKSIGVWISLLESLSNKHIRFVFLVVFAIRVSYQSFNMYWSPILAELTGDTSWLPYFWIGITLSLALGSWVAKAVKSFTKRKLVLSVAAIGVIMVTVSLSGQLFLIVVGFLLHEVIRELLDRIIWTYSNQFIGDGNRSTMNSLRGTVGMLGNIAGLALSYLLSSIGLSALFVWAVSGGTLVVFAILLALFYRGK